MKHIISDKTESNLTLTHVREAAARQAGLSLGTYAKADETTINREYERIKRTGRIPGNPVSVALATSVPPCSPVSPLRILSGDAQKQLRKLPSESVHCCVTSPPYYRQRDYGADGQIGQEQSVAVYIANLRAVFREVHRVLHPTGTLWVNIGDSQLHKNLLLVPYRLAIGMQDDGWILRSHIVWQKTAPMPESCTDRPTNAWEPVFLFAKCPRYFYDPVTVREKSVSPRTPRPFGKKKNGDRNDQGRIYTGSEHRNLRSVWTLGPEPFRGEHFAPFPTEIPRKAIRAATSEMGCCPQCLSPWERITRKTRIPGVYGSLRKRADAPGAVTSPTSVFRTGDRVVVETIGWEPTCSCGLHEVIPCTVLDPFAGSGTTAGVALEQNRRVILVELNPDYCVMARKRAIAIPRMLEVFDEVAC